MPNIYLKVIIDEENWPFWNFEFLGLKNLSPSQFWAALTHDVFFEL